MSFNPTPRQNEAREIMGSDAKHCMFFGGSRSGKTFIICRQIAVRALKAEGSRHLIARYRFNAVKQSIWYDTFPKMIEICWPGLWKKVHQDKQESRLIFPNKSEIWFGGLDDKERTEKILGQEYATIFLNECSQISYSTIELVRTRLAQNIGLKLKLFYDENPPLRTHWSHRLFIEKRNAEPPYAGLGDACDDYASLLMNPQDNEANLPAEYLEELQKLSPRQRARFWEGKFGDATENALWSYETIEAHRVSQTPDLQRIVVAIDPSGTRGEEDERSDHVGIVVVSLGVDGHGYVLEDLTCKAPPSVWGRIAATAYDRHDADCVVGEVNFGGAMVEHVVKTAASNLDLNIPYKEVRASRGKVVRAEPISSLYEQGKVHHAGRFGELEDEMCSFTTAGYMGDKSPDRADALVWGLSELFPGMTRKKVQHHAVIENASRYQPHAFA